MADLFLAQLLSGQGPYGKKAWHQTSPRKNSIERVKKRRGSISRSSARIALIRIS
jgi:hypothetical protein